MIHQTLALAYPDETVARAGWQAINSVLSLPDLGALDLRVPLWGRISDETRDLVEAARKHGKQVRIHAWVGRRGKGGASVATEADGYAQGQRLALRARQLGASVASANAERDVYRGKLKRQNPSAMDFLRGLQRGFAEGLDGHTCKLCDVGYLDPRVHYRGGILAPDVVEGWDLWAAMLYQRSAKRARAKLDKGRNHRRLLSDPPYTEMDLWLPVGRINAAGLVVGDYKGWLAQIPTLPPDVTGLTHYVGLGPDRGLARAAWRMLTEGHRRHPPLIETIPAFARASEPGAGETRRVA